MNSFDTNFRWMKLKTDISEVQRGVSQQRVKRLGYSQTVVYIIALVAALLLGCLPSGAQDSPTDHVPTEASSPSLNASARPTLTLTPSAAPTLTEPPQPTRVPPGDFAYPEGDYLFTDTSGCSLPCWHGLQIGSSDLAAFHHIAREVFAFDDTNLRGAESALVFSGLPDSIIQSTDVTGYDLAIGSDGELEVYTLGDIDTGLLRALAFHQYSPSGNSPFSFHTPQTVLRLLGEPTAIYAQFLENPPNLPGGGLGRILIMYEEGITFWTIHETTFFSDGQFCLDQPTSNESIFITEPFSEDFASLNELQDRLLFDGRRDYAHFDTMFGVSLAEITLLAQTQDNACLEIK